MTGSLRRLRFVPLAFLLVFGGSFRVAAQSINSGSPAHPFPQNAAYPFGIKPNHKTTAQFQSDVQNLYNNWYSNAVTAGGTTRNAGVSTCAGCLRVFRGTNSNDTVSEGIGYGMLIAAMMGDKTLFDGLYKYALQYIPDTIGHYVMDWNINQNGGVIGTNGATDADFDMAQALLIAEQQWGNGTGINYRGEFQKFCNTIWAFEISNTTDYHIKPGDNWDTTWYPDYASPAWFKCWSSATNNANHNWPNAINWVYQTYDKALLNAYPLGFKPDSTNTSMGANGTNMSYEGSRYPLRTGIDELWNGDPFPTAKEGPLDNLQPMVANMIGNYNSQGAGYFKDNFVITSGASSGNVNSLYPGPVLVAAMADGTNQAFTNALYDLTTTRYAIGGFKYFQDTLGLMGILVGSGNFPNLACGVPAGSPTLTPTLAPNTATFTPSRTPTRTPSSTPSFTLTPTRSATATPSPSATTSRTPTASLTPTGTASGTNSFTPTPTRTPTSTWTPPPTSTKTFTPSPTGTFTPSWTPPPGATATYTPTPTWSWTPSATPTATDTRTPTMSPTPGSPTVTPVPGQASSAVSTPIAWPNPVSTGDLVQIHFTLGQGAPEITLRLYTVAYRRVVVQEFRRAFAPGTYDLPLDLRDLKGRPLADGCYLLVLDTGITQATGRLVLAR